MDVFQKLLDLLNQLDENRIYYSLGHYRNETLVVKVDLPSERWEIEFFADGEIEIEIFRSESGVFGDEKAKRILANLFADQKPTSQPSPNRKS